MSEKYTQILDLAKLDVFKQTEINSDLYFEIRGLPPTLTYGKHAFSIIFKDPENEPLLKNGSHVLFEFIDSRGLILFSDLVDIDAVSGAGNGFLWIKNDPL